MNALNPLPDDVIADSDWVSTFLVPRVHIIRKLKVSLHGIGNVD